MYIIKYKGWYGFLKTFKLFRIFSEKNLIFTKLLGGGDQGTFRSSSGSATGILYTTF